MVLIFTLNGKPSSLNTAMGKLQADRLPILTVNRRDTPPETQKRRQDNSSRLSVVVLPFRETGKPPLFVPVFRDVSHNLCDEKAIRISFPQLLL
jgi:hypothetical protein